MRKLCAAALVLGALGATLAACGDTRSNKDLSGVATWPAGGPASGAYNPGYSSSTTYGSSTDTTVRTTTYPPPYAAPPAYAPPPSYPPGYAPAPYPPPPYPPPGGYR